MNFFISNAIASLNNSTQKEPYSAIIMLIIFGIIFYIIILYPQYKRTKNHKKLINSISKGNEIITAGGLIGRITKINESNIIILLNNNVEVMIKRDFIVAILPKGTMKIL
ncbi:UPF0092 membrane protein YajC [Serratia symbiotica]|nr:UPF0092 membrane protein YajC [Serratia symbiotica]